MGKADTSVACSTLDNGSTGFYPQHCMRHKAHYAHSPTLLLRILDYADSSTVFNVASGILGFNLPVNFASCQLCSVLR
jgi:hypothetical protein